MDKFLYLVSEGLKNVWRHKMTTFTAVFSLFLALYFVGLLATAGENTRSILQYLRSKYKIEVFFKQNVDLKMAKKVSDSILGIKGVRSSTVINKDDAVGAQIIKQLRSDISLLTFSLDNTSADLYCSDITLSAIGIEATINTPWGSGKLKSNLLGQFNLSNLLAIIAVACSQGAVLDDCLKVVPELLAVSGRMELVSAHMQPQVVVDYAHTPDALEKALQALKPYCNGRLWVIFGCGGNRDNGKREQMGKIADQYADRVVITNDNPRFEAPEKIVQQILEGIDGETDVELDRRRAIATSIIQAEKQDIVLIAGKGHENYQILGSSRIAFSDQEEALAALETAQLNSSPSIEGGIL